MSVTNPETVRFDYLRKLFQADLRPALREYIARRRQQPGFANARSLRNAFDRARLRQALRLVQWEGAVGVNDLVTLEESDIRASRVFSESVHTNN